MMLPPWPNDSLVIYGPESALTKFWDHDGDGLYQQISHMQVWCHSKFWKSTKSKQVHKIEGIDISYLLG